MKPSDRLLFFTGDIDFKHFESSINNFGFEAVYSSDVNEFKNLCTENKYDIIAYNGYEQDGIDASILKSLTGSMNIYTPVLIIAGKEDEKLMNICLRHQFDLVIFPFTSTELIIRLQLAVRRKNTETTIHNKLIDQNVLYENFPAGILQTDAQGNFIRFNKELKDILGMSDIDFSGINFFQLCHPDDYLMERQSLDRMLRKETDRVSYEVRLINNDGKTIVCKIRASAVWKNQNSLSSFIFSVEKIS
ncbi:MAG TPA: hypothetical protein DEQ09_11675 [Bacteroidales bacterium]|nr:hypothetical protein [Bacteroidales bacterium]